LEDLLPHADRIAVLLPDTDIPAAVLSLRRARSLRQGRPRQPIDPNHCHFMLPSDYMSRDGWETDYYTMWHQPTYPTQSTRKWKLAAINAPLNDDDDNDDDDGSATAKVRDWQAGVNDVGVIGVRVVGSLVVVRTFQVHDGYRGMGYGTAFAKRLNTLLKKEYGFADYGSTNVSVWAVDKWDFPFWKKAVGIRHFMKTADAWFEDYDLTSTGGLPTEQQLRYLWGDVCSHSDDVVDVLVLEWRKRAKRAAKRASAK
jgi:GNAT superfamily N-acetyltransferase